MLPLDQPMSTDLLYEAQNNAHYSHMNFWILLVFIVVIAAVCYIVATNKKVKPVLDTPTMS